MNHHPREQDVVSPAFRAIVREMLELLTSLRSQAESAKGTDLAAEFPRLEHGLDRFEAAARDIPTEVAGLHREFARTMLHPLLRQSAFVDRAFTKPLGYAGDYETINHVLLEPRVAKDTFSRWIDTLALATAPAVAHRHRITILVRLLEQEARRVHAEGQSLRVLSVGCGPAKEVRLFLEASPEAHACHTTLLDFSREALEYGRAKISAIPRDHGVGVTFELASVEDLLRRALDPGTSPREFDLIYCAGLFDYLTDSICRRLVSLFRLWLAPKGLLAVTNIHKRNPHRQFMEHLLDWHVIHRDDEEVRSLAPPETLCDLFCDPTGVNAFLTTRAPKP